MGWRSGYDSDVERPHPVVAELQQLEDAWASEAFVIDKRDERGVGLGMSDAEREAYHRYGDELQRDPAWAIIVAAMVLAGVAVAAVAVVSLLS